jgi:ABC-type transport system involved in multi-copper enzyme maturation permease subunit
MTASFSRTAESVSSVPRIGALPGFGGLFRKELKEWRRARRTWVVMVITALFMTLAALNAWLQSVLPADVTEDAAAPIFDPMANLIGSVGSQIFAVAAIFAVMGLIVAERESGILAWTASKPVSRSGIWLAKFGSSIGILWIVAGIIPLAATVALIFTLYGPVAFAPVAVMAIGTGLSIGFYVAVSLAASTVVTSQAAVAGIALGAMFLPQLFGIVVPAEFLPTSILPWTIAAATEGVPTLVTPLVWFVTIVVLVAFSLRRMERMEL